MQLNVRDVAAIFRVPESQVYRWVADDHMPVLQIDGRSFFNRDQLLEWATTRRISFSPHLLGTPGSQTPETPGLVAAFEFGGGVHRLSASTRDQVLAEMVRALPLPNGADREMLLELFLAREDLSSTAVGEGIAIPHPQDPVILHVAQPLLAVCYIDDPVDFKANDGQPIHTLFTLISPSIRVHLKMLARVAGALRDSAFRAVLKRRGGTDEVLAELRRIEAEKTAEAEQGRPSGASVQ